MCLKTVTCLQRQIFNNIAINLHACISTTSVHATFACMSLTNTRKSPSCNISKNTIPHELWLLNVLLLLSPAEMFADTEPQIYKRHCVKSGWVHTATFHLQHNRTLAISLQTASLTEPTIQYIQNLKPWPQNQKYINDTVWNLDESTQQLSTFNIIALLPYIYKPQASLNQQSSIFKIWNLGKGDILQFPP